MADGKIIGRFIDGLMRNGMPPSLNDIIGENIFNSDTSKNRLKDLFDAGIIADYQKKIIDSFKGLADDVSKEWGKMDQAAFNFGKQIGLTTNAIEGLRDQLLNLSTLKFEGLSAKLNMTVEEMIQLHGKFNSAVERSVQMTNDQITALSSMSRVVGDDIAVKLTASLDNFGLSATDAGDKLAEMYNKSAKQGISLEKYAKNVADHIGLAQKYTFKNGVDGLTAMAEKAAKMRVDMDMVASLADKLSTISGAVTTSADLQVLGGEFAQFADPMGLLHDSLNDMEGLQDRLVNLTNSLGRFNRETGEIEIATFDKMRLKQAASAMGVDYGKLIDQTTTAARRNEVEYQMNGLTNIPDEYKELLMNTATFQNGVAGAKDANGNFKSLNELTHKDLEKLADLSKSEEQNIADIAGMLRGFLDVREGEEKQKGTETAKRFEKESASIKDIYNAIGRSEAALHSLVQIEIASKWVSPLYQQFGGGKLMGLRDKFLKGLILSNTIFGNAHGGIIRTHSDGGYISDGTPGKEMILNSAQHGEFVMNAQSTQMFLPMLMMMNRNPMGMMNMMGTPYGGMMSTFGGGMVQGVQPQGYSGIQAAYYNRIIGNLETSASQLKANAMKQSQYLNNMGDFYAEKIRQERVFSRSFGNGRLGPGRYEQEYNSLVTNEGRVWRKSVQANNTALQERYANIKMAKFNKGMQIAGNAGMGVMSGAMVGMGTWGQYQQNGTAIMDRGKALGGSIGAGVGSAVATGLLSCIPMIGPIIGPTLGPMLGGAIGKGVGEAIGKGSEKREKATYDNIAKTMENEKGRTLFNNLKGDYSVSELKAIGTALQDGAFKNTDVTPELLEKLKANGNDIILNNKTNSHAHYVKSHEWGGWWNKTRTNSETQIDESNSIRGGEYVVNTQNAQKSPGILNSVNSGQMNDSNISSLLPLGPVVKVLEKVVDNIKSVPQNITMDPININISGTIQLDCGQGNTMDIGKELMQNPTFVNKLTDLITKQININDNAGSFDKKNFFQRYLSI